VCWWTTGLDYDVFGLRQRLSSATKVLAGVKHHTPVKATLKVEEDHMAQFVGVNCALYAHSLVHTTVAQRDLATLCHILSTLPRPARAGEVTTKAQSIEAE